MKPIHVRNISRLTALCFSTLTLFNAMGGELPPQYPRVRGDYQMTHTWHVTLPDEYAKRFEEGEFGTDLVLWRPGITCWTSIFNQKAGETPAMTYEWRKSRVPKEAVQVFEFRDTKPMRFGYLLHEKPDNAAERWALYTLTFGEDGHVLMAIYFDRQSDLDVAKKIWFSITNNPK